MKICEELAGSQNALAKKAGIAQSTIRGYSSRNAEPPRDVLIQLAQAAGVSTQWLATGEGAMTPKQPVASLATEVNNLDKGITEIATVVAKAYSVPVEFAHLRLSGSEEIKALRRAMEEGSRFRPIPIITAATPLADWPIWGMLSRESLQDAAPQSKPENIAVYQVATTQLGSRFAAGDWVLIDLKAEIATGTYCLVAEGSSTVEVRDIKVVSTGDVQLSGQRDCAGSWSGQKLANSYALRKKFPVVGRLVAAIRFVGQEQTRKG